MAESPTITGESGGLIEPGDEDTISGETDGGEDGLAPRPSRDGLVGWTRKWIATVGEAVAFEGSAELGLEPGT